VELPNLVQQRVLKETPARKGREPARLVHDQNLSVNKEDWAAQRRIGLDPRWAMPLEILLRPQHCPLFGRHTVEDQSSCRDMGAPLEQGRVAIPER